MENSNKERTSSGRRPTSLTYAGCCQSTQDDTTASRPDDGFGESYQSTDTVRHRPEVAGYGACSILVFDLSNAVACSLLLRLC